MPGPFQVDWSVQRQAFAWDGSWRDLYVLGAGELNWQRVLDLIREGPYRAELQSDLPAPLRWEARELLAAGASATRPLLHFWVGELLLACHFFDCDDIEFDLDAREVSEAQLAGLLDFMVRLGDVTASPVVLTEENRKEAEWFRYEPGTKQMSWIAPGPA
jgi:hypothetical protein